MTIDFPADPQAVLQAANCERAATLPRLYDAWFTGERDVWFGQTRALLNLVDPIVRTLCSEFGFRFGRGSLDQFLMPEKLFEVAFCSQDSMPDLYESTAVLRLRAKFSILPRIRDAREAADVISGGERFLHPMHYVAMPAQFWLRDESCVIPTDDIELSTFLQGYDEC